MRSWGGAPIDLLLGIKYLSYYPKLVLTLPGGLCVYKTQFATPSGNLAVLGGPYKAWGHALKMACHFSPKVFFTLEARALFTQSSWVRLSQDKEFGVSRYMNQ